MEAEKVKIPFQIEFRGRLQRMESEARRKLRRGRRLPVMVKTLIVVTSLKIKIADKDKIQIKELVKEKQQ